MNTRTVMLATLIALGWRMDRARAATVFTDELVINSSGRSDLKASFPGGRSVWFELTPNAYRQIEAVSWTLDSDGSDWYIVEPGDRFAEDRILAGEFPLIYTNDQPQPPQAIEFTEYVGSQFEPPLPDFSPSQATFYLGWATSLHGLDGGPVGPGFRTVFGWVEVSLNAQGQWYAVNSATAYDAKGIFIGTMTAIPEPLVESLAATCLACVIVHSRKRLARNSIA